MYYLMVIFLSLFFVTQYNLTLDNCERFTESSILSRKRRNIKCLEVEIQMKRCSNEEYSYLVEELEILKQEINK